MRRVRAAMAPPQLRKRMKGEQRLPGRASPSHTRPRAGAGEIRCPHPPAQGLRPHGEIRFPHSPAGRGVGKPGFPTPLAEGVGSRETVMRKAHHARCKRPGSAGSPPAARLRGHGNGPRPDPPPLGAGTRRLPPAGGGWEGANPGERWSPQPSMRLAPHTDGMNIRLFLLPPGGGMGKPGFPTPLAEGVCSR